MMAPFARLLCRLEADRQLGCLGWLDHVQPFQFVTPGIPDVDVSGVLGDVHEVGVHLQCCRCPLHSPARDPPGANLQRQKIGRAWVIERTEVECWAAHLNAVMRDCGRTPANRLASDDGSLLLAAPGSLLSLLRELGERARASPAG